MQSEVEQTKGRVSMREQKNATRQDTHRGVALLFIAAILLNVGETTGEVS